MPIMTEKKKKPGKPGRPKALGRTSSKMLRLDDHIHALLAVLSTEENRPISWELKPLLISHLRKKGYIPVTPEIVEKIKREELWTDKVQQLIAADKLTE